MRSLINGHDFPSLSPSSHYPVFDTKGETLTSPPLPLQVKFFPLQIVLSSSLPRRALPPSKLQLNPSAPTALYKSNTICSPPKIEFTTARKFALPPTPTSMSCLGRALCGSVCGGSLVRHHLSWSGYPFGAPEVRPPGFQP